VDTSATTAVLSLSFLKDLRGLVNNPDFADVCFIVEGQVLYAHRAILAARCDHFRCVPWAVGTRRCEGCVLSA
jgi:hypothetical protein